MEKIVNIQKRVLEANEEVAERLKRNFESSGTLVINLISSPGSGKTTLLERSVEKLKSQLKLGVLEGDIETERDADRLRKLGIPAYQILTGGACHLNARQIETALSKAKFGPLDILFIENVGNLICPTSYDLGEDYKVSLLSVTEGDDKPFKYPAIFSAAAVTLITKIDLQPHVDFDLDAVITQVKTLNPAGTRIVTSTRTGEGIDTWCSHLMASLKGKRS